MSEPDADEDKQYEASQHKLNEARKKGDFAKSIDLNTAFAYLGFIAISFSFGATSLIHLGAEFSGLLSRSDQLASDVFDGSGAPLMGGILIGVGSWLLPWFLIPAAFVLLSLTIQKGIVFAPSKLEFKVSRISPIAQAKNKFGRSGIFEFAKSFIKLVLYSLVLFLFLASELPEILGAMAMSPSQIVVILLNMCMSMFVIVFLIAVSLGGVDYIWQRAEHLRKNRMSRKELTDETKNSEGDPAMKQQRRQKGVAIAMNQMLAEVPNADVVLVNPTHYAVALKWDRQGTGAPECIAKGVDFIALNIREIAHENGIPIHSDPPTARALYATVEIGQKVPPDHYKAVAAAIRFADRMKKLAKR